MATLPSFRRAYPDFPIAAKTALGFWLLYFTLVTVRVATGGGAMDGRDFDPFDLALRRALVTLLGIGLSFVIYLFLQRVRDRGLGVQIATAGLLAIPFALLLSATHFYAFNIFQPPDPWWQELDAGARIFKARNHMLDLAIHWLFFFIAWAALYLAITFAARTVAAERSVSRYRAEAQSAQLRALRYQINPHFLFNTLNSLSSLIMAQRVDEADRMTMNLATFFRSTLAVDPGDDVRLDEEIALQRLYLDIERVRFPDRLRTTIDVPDDLANARIPALILQPLVENAIKYGVARTRRAVTVSITAYREAGALHIKVADDGDEAPVDFPGRPDDGTGVGLRNVGERLRARFGDASGLFAGPNPGGGFTVHLIMPVLIDD